MSNVKAQSSNEIQNPKWKKYDPRFSCQREKYFDFESFELHLTFGPALFVGDLLGKLKIWQHLN